MQRISNCSKIKNTVLTPDWRMRKMVVTREWWITGESSF